jgi:UDP-2,4-diacetamido-2,4,6-trideoxy-beta-L-altropyranose hydrolase
MKVKIRRVVKSDIHTTFKWVNHDVIRKFSINTQTVNFHSHRNWFSKKIQSKDTAYFILESADKIALGSIRFDFNNGTGKINYLVDPQYHGMGLGSILLKEGLTVLRKEFSEIKSVYGWVFQANIASVKIFEKLKFQLTEQKNGMLKFEYQIGTHED